MHETYLTCKRAIHLMCCDYNLVCHTSYMDSFKGVKFQNEYCAKPNKIFVHITIYTTALQFLGFENIRWNYLNLKAMLTVSNDDVILAFHFSKYIYLNFMNWLSNF